MRREKANYIIQSVSHALDVLEQFQGSADEIGVTELSKRLKLHKNNVFRLLATLESRGYIEQNRATENYRLGARCLQLGQHYVHQIGFLSQAKLTLKELALGTHESAYVSLRRGTDVVPLDFVESEHKVRVVSLLGMALPLHCTAPGKVHLAFEMEGDLRDSLPENLVRYTEKTVVDRAALLKQLKEITEKGYALDWGEFLEDVRGLAVPVRDYARSLVGAVAVAGPAYRLTPERLEKEIAPLVMKGGKELSERLGYQS